MINRRSLITGLVSFVAAPAIVRVSSLMPVKAIEPQFIITEYPMSATRLKIDILYGIKFLTKEAAIMLNQNNEFYK